MKHHYGKRKSKGKKKIDVVQSKELYELVKGTENYTFATIVSSPVPTVVGVAGSGDMSAFSLVYPFAKPSAGAGLGLRLKTSIQPVRFKCNYVISANVNAAGTNASVGASSIVCRVMMIRYRVPRGNPSVAAGGLDPLIIDTFPMIGTAAMASGNAYAFKDPLNNTGNVHILYDKFHTIDNANNGITVAHTSRGHINIDLKNKPRITYNNNTTYNASTGTESELYAIYMWNDNASATPNTSNPTIRAAWTAQYLG